MEPTADMKERELFVCFGCLGVLPYLAESSAITYHIILCISSTGRLNKIRGKVLS